MVSQLISVITILVACNIVDSHVSLTFPPARKYDLDFLDNVRTKGACGGMPKGDIKTSIKNDGKLKVDWHLGYAHNGGFRIELLDKGEKKLIDFTGGFRTDDKFAHSYEINIPSSLECIGCVLKLTRQASEWKNYEFYSCADVDIVASLNYNSAYCSNKGTPSGQSCQCDKGYYGDRCQFYQDCDTDFDCQNNGKCIDVQGTALPKKECYCPIGYYGRTCDKISPIKSKSWNATDYTEIDLRQNFKFYWRLLGQFQNTMEGIIVAGTTSYAAVGWRDANEEPICQKFPTDVGHPVIPKSLHPMDCQDVVIGKAFGSFSHVADYYTRDRSTPRRDEVYGGEDDLVAAAGWEEDGVTTIMFRKPVDSGDMADNKFEGDLKFIYAFGQTPTDFYKADELKYHLGNRGHLSKFFFKLLFCFVLHFVLFIFRYPGQNKFCFYCCYTI